MLSLLFRQTMSYALAILSGISLSTEQWSAFKQKVPDIQAAITKLESRIR